MQIFAYDFTPYQARQQYNFRTFSEILLLAVNYMRSPRSVMMVEDSQQKCWTYNKAIRHGISVK